MPNPGPYGAPPLEQWSQTAGLWPWPWPNRAETLALRALGAIHGPSPEQRESAKPMRDREAWARAMQTVESWRSRTVRVRIEGGEILWEAPDG